MGTHIHTTGDGWEVRRVARAGAEDAHDYHSPQRSMRQTDLYPLVFTVRMCELHGFLVQQMQLLTSQSGNLVAGSLDAACQMHHLEKSHPVVCEASAT